MSFHAKNRDIGRFDGEALGRVDGRVDQGLANEIAELSRRSRSLFFGGEDDAADTFDIVFLIIRDSIRLTAVTIVPNGTLTADDTNNAEIVVSRSRGGAEPIPLATLVTNTASGNWLANASRSVPFVATQDDLLLLPGDVLILDVAKNGTGVQIDPDVYLQVDFE